MASSEQLSLLRLSDARATIRSSTSKAAQPSTVNSEISIPNTCFLEGAWEGSGLAGTWWNSGILRGRVRSI